MTVYPRSGTVEVVFQHMRRRPVFDELELREAFRDQLAPAGITIPDAKLNLRPSFPITLLAVAERPQAVATALDWFAETFQRVVEGASNRDEPVLDVRDDVPSML